VSAMAAVMTDLPSRPPRRDDEPVEKIADTDRVKAKTDKIEPRFEAQRQRVAREEARRARAEAARQAREAGDDAALTSESDETDEDAAEAAPRTGFSFNQTIRRPSGDERNGSDR
jgi:hypothetical protein